MILRIHSEYYTTLTSNKNIIAAVSLYSRNLNLLICPTVRMVDKAMHEM